MHCALLERCCTAGRVFGRWRRCFELTSRVVRCFCGAAESRVSSGSGGNGRRDSGTAQARGRTVWMDLGIKSSKKCTNNSALGFTPECTNAGNTQPNAPRLGPDTGVEERSRDPGGVRQVTAGNGGMESVFGDRVLEIERVSTARTGCLKLVRNPSSTISCSWTLLG